MSAKFKHSSESNEHYTPPEIVEAARKVLGKIDLDPFSCELANSVVEADVFFGADDNGFEQEWFGRVFCNPPGGLVADSVELGNGKTRSSSAVAWAKLLREYDAGNVHAAVFVGFNLEVMRMTQLATKSVLEFPFCVPKDRLHFWGEDVGFGEGSPQYPNVLVFVPPKGNFIMPGYFRDVFAQFGKVVLP